MGSRLSNSATWQYFKNCDWESSPIRQRTITLSKIKGPDTYFLSQFSSQNRNRTCYLGRLYTVITLRVFSSPSLPAFINLIVTLTISDYIGHGFGFPLCVHSFRSCVFIRFKNPVPTKKSLLFVPQKLLKRPYRCLVYFNRLSYTFYIQNSSLIRREPK